MWITIVGIVIGELQSGIGVGGLSLVRVGAG